jgi:lipoate-protein ligase A
VQRNLNLARKPFANAFMIFDQLTAILDPEPHAAALNMAIDEVLLRSADEPQLRVYRWVRAAVSFGYFGKYSAVAARWPGRDIVRRWTGGGEVLHGADCTYTLVVPRAHPFCRRNAAESYRVIHEYLARLLATAAVAVTAVPPISAACFENVVRFDVLVGTHKVAGAAQRRTVHGLLHQGSIEGEVLDESFTERFANSLAGQVRTRPLSPDELALAHGIARKKYGTDAWLRRFDTKAGAGDEGTL